jgi:hypothetical protein
LVGLLLAWGAVAWASSPPPADEEKEELSAHAAAVSDGANGNVKHAAAVQEIVHRLGPPLGGRFDLNALRSGDRVKHWRHAFALRSVTLTRNLRQPIQVRLELVVEFGDESGMAELPHKEAQILDALDAIVGRADAASLLTTGGKIELKIQLMREINRQLRTARARDLYITSFIMLAQ